MLRVANDRSSPVLRRLIGAGLAALMSASMVPDAMAAGSVANFVENLWPEARARGVSRNVFDAALGNFQPSEKVMELTRKQPEFTSTVGQYIGKRVTDAQAGRGQAMAAEWRKTLANVESQYGVSSEAILAIWGMETNFGSFMGGNNTFHALATLTYGGYRADYFRSELLTALEIANAGHASPSSMVGSWAGAMGHTQFMPTSFARFAVDYNGDRRKDIWNSVPDALASTANYLKQNGWRPGESWGYEVKLPANFDFERAWSIKSASLADWHQMGVSRVSGRAFPRAGDAARLYMPSGANGPVFLLTHNFEVIKRYNNSDSYALAVGHLADRIIGGGRFAQAFPEGETGMGAKERKEVQTLLARHGYDVGTPDGKVGPKTRAAIMAFQRSNGLVPDGHASSRLLSNLR